MPCYHPIPAWYSGTRNESGKRSLVFSPAGSTGRKAVVPCGTCIGCKLERSRQWALRCVHESKLWEDNCFVTLTYEHMPRGGSLVPKHFQDWLKRLRWHFDGGIRFFGCGEYGDSLERPHYHALLFNCDFVDRKPYKAGLYTSKLLEDIWQHGLCVVGDVTFESAAYIARYSLKKVTGTGAVHHYKGREPEFLRMSRRPGIGSGFLDKYKSDIYPSDECIIRGKPSKPPRYYDERMGITAPSVLARIKSRRRVAASASVDNSGSRLIVREVVKTAAVKLLTRGLEVDDA